MPEAAALLRTARRRAGLSQVELARRAGVTQSVISAYESGTRQPSVPTLERLIAASGYQLELSLRGGEAESDGESILERLRDRREQVIETAAMHGLTNVRVFGSVARHQARALVVEDQVVTVEGSISPASNRRKPSRTCSRRP